MPIHRNGRIEEVYWTYGYSPVYKSSGKLLAPWWFARKPQIQFWQSACSSERWNGLQIFSSRRGVFCVLNGPSSSSRWLTVLSAIDRASQRYWKSLREAVPEAEEQGFIKLLNGVYQTGAPFVGRGTPVQLARTPDHPLELRYLDFVYQPKREPDGTVSGIIVLGVDVTDAKKSEQILLQSEKLNAVGRLASTIAHEINNPLEAVTNLVFLAQSATVNPEVKEFLAARKLNCVGSRRSPTRHYNSIDNRRIRGRSRLPTSSMPRSRSTTADSRTLASKSSDVIAHGDVTCFDGEIRQVLSNLIGNAIDAMPGKERRPVIRSRESTDWSTGRSGVTLTIADTGSGVSPIRLPAFLSLLYHERRQGHRYRALD